MRETMKEMIIDWKGKRKEAQQKFSEAEEQSKHEQTPFLYGNALSDYKNLVSKVAQATSNNELMRTCGKEFQNTATELEVLCILNSAVCTSRLRQWAETIRFTNMILDNKQRHKYPNLDNQQIFSAKYLKTFSMLLMMEHKSGSRNYVPSIIVEINDMNSIIAESSCESCVISEWKTKYRELVNMLSQYKQHKTALNPTTAPSKAPTITNINTSTSSHTNNLRHVPDITLLAVSLPPPPMPSGVNKDHKAHRIVNRSSGTASSSSVSASASTQPVSSYTLLQDGKYKEGQ
jgi:hypothetical protein